MRRLFQECKIGKGNAALLSEALAFATPEDLSRKDIIRVSLVNLGKMDVELGYSFVQEFCLKCRSSQELIFAQIPWATACAERSRLVRGESPIFHVNDSFPTIATSRLEYDDSSVELTPQEQLLAALLDANEELLEALRVYDDLEGLAIERRTEERSRRETVMGQAVSLSSL
jgi:hypothetical protein